MLTYREFLNEQLKNPEFFKEYYALKPEFEEIKRKLRSEIEQERKAQSVQPPQIAEEYISVRV